MTWSFIDNYLGSRYVKYGSYYYFDVGQLKIDQHYVTFTAKDSFNIDDIFVYTLNPDCVECPYTFLDKAKTNVTATNLKFRIAANTTSFPTYFPENETENVICDLDPHFGQHAVYNINVNQSHCEIDVLKDPVNIYSPIVSVILIYLLIYLSIFGLKILYKKWTSKKIIIQREMDFKTPKEPPKKQRVLAIDTFRGIAIVLMIFANYGHGGYHILEHTTWNGLHMSDLVFPWFMWIMGACIPISLTSSFNRGEPNRSIILKVAKRSSKLFLLGLCLGIGDLYHMRIMGVLQRFAICYLTVAAICIYFMQRHVFVKEGSKMVYFQDIIKLAMGWLVAIAILTVHTILIFVVAEPGCPRGYMGPGGLHKHGIYADCIGGATGYIDGKILGIHRYQSPTIYKVYEAKPFDPEGFVGCLTSIFHVFIGVQAGTILLVYQKHSDRIIRWLIWALVTGLIGGGLCGFSKESGIIPVNKNLWSLSFVMVTSCFAFLLLTFCYVLIDVKKYWNGKPFLFAGMNAIILYVGHELLDNHFPIRWYFYDGDDSEWRKTHFFSLLSDAWATTFWIIVAYIMYRKKFFFKV